MTFTITLPDEIARPLVPLSPTERDSYIADLLADARDAEDDLHLAEQEALQRGIADDEAGRFMSYETLVARMEEYKAKARAK